MKSDLSLLIITLNEEERIERCIKSVPFAAEVVVVDSGSQDKTCELAQNLGATAVYHQWEGYGAQKNFAAKLCGKNWILSIDADEWLSPELAEEIKALLNRNGDGFSVFAMKRLSRYLGRDIKHGGWFPDWQTRLYKKGAANWDKGERIHETVKTKEHVGRLGGNLCHEPFRTIKEQLDTNTSYAGLLAAKKFGEGRRISFASYIVVKTFFRFIENYFLKLGMLDGVAGFVIAWNSAQSYMMQLHSIYEMSKKEKQKQVSQ
jgi:glycosyltransferase involved in cell wall biosynthesis